MTKEAKKDKNTQKTKTEKKDAEKLNIKKSSSILIVICACLALLLAIGYAALSDTKGTYSASCGWDASTTYINLDGNTVYTKVNPTDGYTQSGCCSYYGFFTYGSNYCGQTIKSGSDSYGSYKYYTSAGSDFCVSGYSYSSSNGTCYKYTSVNSSSSAATNSCSIDASTTYINSAGNTVLAKPVISGTYTVSSCCDKYGFDVSGNYCTQTIRNDGKNYYYYAASQSYCTSGYTFTSNYTYSGSGGSACYKAISSPSSSSSGSSNNSSNTTACSGAWPDSANINGNIVYFTLNTGYFANDCCPLYGFEFEENTNQCRQSIKQDSTNNTYYYTSYAAKYCVSGYTYNSSTHRCSKPMSSSDVNGKYKIIYKDSSKTYSDYTVTQSSSTFTAISGWWRSGYLFESWSKSSSCSTIDYRALDTIVVTDSQNPLTLYACWVEAPSSSCNWEPSSTHFNLNGDTVLTKINNTSCCNNYSYLTPYGNNYCMQTVKSDSLGQYYYAYNSTFCVGDYKTYTNNRCYKTSTTSSCGFANTATLSQDGISNVYLKLSPTGSYTVQGCCSAYSNLGFYKSSYGDYCGQVIKEGTDSNGTYRYYWTADAKYCVGDYKYGSNAYGSYCYKYITGGSSGTTPVPSICTNCSYIEPSNPNPPSGVDPSSSSKSSSSKSSSSNGLPNNSSSQSNNYNSEPSNNNINNNPQTGSTLVIVTLIVAILFGGYSAWYFTQMKKDKKEG